MTKEQIRIEADKYNRSLSKHPMSVQELTEVLVGFYAHLQLLQQTDVIRRQNWVCNSCGFSDYTDAVTEQELEEWLQCSNCGGDEFHLEPVVGGV